MALNRTFRLNNGLTIPAIGLGTWRAEPNKVGEAVKVALKVGYKHFDCAFIYENEAEIGQVFESSPEFKRDEIFITSKLWNSNHADPSKAVQKTLDDLKLKYLDLYLIHWPIENDPATKINTMINGEKLRAVWAKMEKLVDEGKVKSIGVSNCTIQHLEDILLTCRIKPAMNQVELHPYLPQNELVEYCKNHGILLTAYAPLGSQSPEAPLYDETIKEIAERNNKTVAQVLISWAVQRGTVVIPKSSTPSRIESNFHDFILSDKDMEVLNSLHQQNRKRYCDPFTFWKLDLFNEH